MHVELHVHSVVSIVALVSVLSLVVPSDVYCKQPSGVIVAFQCRSCISITREDRILPVSLHEKLYPDDMLSISDKEGRLVYRLFGAGRNTTLTWSDGTRQIGLPAGPDRQSLVVSTFFAAITRLVNIRFDVQRVGPVPFMGTAQPPRFPASGTRMSPQLMPSQLRRIHMTWRYGKPPFRLLVDAYGRTPTSYLTTERRLWLDGISARTGKTVVVTVTDSQGRKTRLHIVVSRTDVAPIHIGGHAYDFAEPTDAMVAAATLYACRGLQFTLAATTWLYEIGQKYLPATLLADSILQTTSAQLPCPGTPK